MPELPRSKGAIAPASPASYFLDAQVGFLLRVLYQRNTTMLSEVLGGLTATQWAAVAKLEELGECSQNLLGRHIAMDAATMKGVIDRLSAKGLIRPRSDPADKRRVLLTLSDEGRQLFRQNIISALSVSDATLGPLTLEEKRAFVRLLTKAAVWSPPGTND